MSTLAQSLLRIEGRVQGVGYREACVAQAQRLHLCGWVRNRLDGAVEVMLQGPDDALARMEAWLWEGPALARVERVVPQALPPSTPAFSGFERRATA